MYLRSLIRLHLSRIVSNWHAAPLQFSKIIIESLNTIKWWGDCEWNDYEFFNSFQRGFRKFSLGKKSSALWAKPQIILGQANLNHTLSIIYSNEMWRLLSD